VVAHVSPRHRCQQQNTVVQVPGCLAATPIECPIDVEDGYPLEMPLVYFFGHATPSDNPELYKV
jgi:polyribonucleotide 5'-hydroxyl-kinase